MADPHTLRCRPGDMAIVLRDSSFHGTSPLAGLVVDVVARALQHGFRAPDGHWHCPAPAPDTWLLKSPRPLRIPTNVGTFWTTSYFVLPDFVLQPLRPDADADDTPVAEPIAEVA